MNDSNRGSISVKTILKNFWNGYRADRRKTMANITENTFEQTTLDWFSSLAWNIAFGPDISPGGPVCERDNYDQVVLLGRLQTALESINPNIPSGAITEAVRKVTLTDSPSLIENNRRFHRMCSPMAWMSLICRMAERFTIRYGCWAMKISRTTTDSQSISSRLSRIEETVERT